MTSFERCLLFTSVSAATATGVIVWVMKDLMRPRDEFSVLGHPWQPQALALHVLVGPAVVFALGLIARGHVLDRLRSVRAWQGRRTGLAVLALSAAMILSGYVLQVITYPGARRWLAHGHLAAGFLFSALFAGHLAAALFVRRGATPQGAAAVDRPGGGV